MTPESGGAKSRDWPPHVWLDASEEGVKNQGKEWASEPCSLFENEIEYISRPEVDALLAQERAKALEEAADDVAHELGAENWATKMLRAKAARGEGNAGK